MSDYTGLAVGGPAAGETLTSPAPWSTIRLGVLDPSRYHQAEEFGEPRAITSASYNWDGGQWIYAPDPPDPAPAHWQRVPAYPGGPL